MTGCKHCAAQNDAWRLGPERCQVKRMWSGLRCVLPSGHEGDHLDFEEAGIDYGDWLWPGRVATPEETSNG